MTFPLIWKRIFAGSLYSFILSLQEASATLLLTVPGKESGMATALVLTGVATEETLRESPLKPDFVFAGIADLPKIL